MRVMSLLYMCVKLMNLGGTGIFGGTGGGVQRYFEHSRNILLFA